MQIKRFIPFVSERNVRLPAETDDVGGRKIRCCWQKGGMKLIEITV